MPSLLKRLAVPALLIALAACGRHETPPPASFKGTDISGASFGGDFSLTAHNGERKSLSDFKGKAVALFFGYTHCPDVCPTTMLEYAAVTKSLGRDAQKLQVLFVTVDPERDTREVLAGYVPHFDPAFLGMTGSRAQVDEVMSRFRIVAQRVAVPGGGYSVDHSAGSYLFDPEGRLRVYEPYATPSASLTHDIRELLR
ncbi:SCO family protein [Paludibacterium paludis]|uniref:Photosynthetic protein synthase I n=1 Tax=Paludibacterium paludis TaxID=1225769 RepID=A0A918P2S9_9NEIS|nr:SCO family protein [Paludibacterium paludis]GGY15461.1 photosynthetic protein synthase I [Paludibacterium paludis]